MVAVDLTGLERDIFPEDGQGLCDSFACGEHELADIDQVHSASLLVLAHKFEPAIALFLSQRSRGSRRALLRISMSRTGFKVSAPCLTAIAMVP
jgi:hypothetical protein